MESHKKQIVVFDFDCTLTKEHLWKNLYEYPRHKKQHKLFLSGSEDARSWVRNFIFGETRITLIRNFLSLITSQGIDIAISSHGNVEDIIRALIYVDIDVNLFKYIHGREELYNIDKKNIIDFQFEKHHFICSFLSIDQTYDHIIFIDDDEPHGIGQYYNYMKDMNNITPIFMHNVKEKDGEHYVDKEQEKGINEEDQMNILNAIQHFQNENK